jgi:hypothetical protein
LRAEPIRTRASANLVDWRQDFELDGCDRSLVSKPLAGVRKMVTSMAQFSLRAVFLFMLLLSLALASIVSGSERIALCLNLLIVILPLIATCLAVYSRGSRRAFWIGVAVFGFWIEHDIPRIRWLDKSLSTPLVGLLGRPIANLHGSHIEHVAYDDIRRSPRYGALNLAEIQEQDPFEWGLRVRMAQNNLEHQIASLTRQWIDLFLALLGGGLIAWLHHLGYAVNDRVRH